MDRVDCGIRNKGEKEICIPVIGFVGEARNILTVYHKLHVYIKISRLFNANVR